MKQYHLTILVQVLGKDDDPDCSGRQPTLADFKDGSHVRTRAIEKIYNCSVVSLEPVIVIGGTR